MSNITDIELIRLYDCSTSTRRGMADQGFPKTMKVLEAMGYVKAKDKGFVVTEEGMACLKLNKEKLFGKRKKEKKPKIKDYDEGDTDFYD